MLRTTGQTGASRGIGLYAGDRQHNLGVYDTLKVARAVLDTARSQKAMRTFVPPDELRARARAQPPAEAERARAEETQRLTLAERGEHWIAGLLASQHVLLRQASATY